MSPATSDPAGWPGSRLAASWGLPARAGEHGKGFAVVAVEVRNLAGQSKQATVQSLASTRQAEKAAKDLNEVARALTETVEQYQLEVGAGVLEVPGT